MLLFFIENNVIPNYWPFLSLSFKYKQKLKKITKYINSIFQNPLEFTGFCGIY